MARAPIAAAVAADGRGVAAERLAGDRHEAQAGGERHQRRQELRRDPWCPACRRPGAAPRPLSRPGRLAARASPAAGLWPPSSQTWCPAGRAVDAGPASGAAAGRASALAAGPGAIAAPSSPASASCRAADDRQAGIVDLVRARPAPAAAARARGRRLDARGRPRLGRHVPVAAVQQERSADLGGTAPAITASARRCLRADAWPARRASGCRPSRPRWPGQRGRRDSSHGPSRRS